MKIIRIIKSLDPAATIEAAIFLGVILGLVLLHDGLRRAGVTSAGELTISAVLILLWLKGAGRK